ncbi:hypothetical protein, partial [Pseudomonas fragariae (ex Marin et al. 2024)]
CGVFIFYYAGGIFLFRFCKLDVKNYRLKIELGAARGGPHAFLDALRPILKAHSATGIDFAARLS